MSTPMSFANQLLIALPTLSDPGFARTAALICQHDGGGAMGVVVNRASDYTLGEVLQQMDIACDDPALIEQRVLAGGRARPGRGSVRPGGGRGWDSRMEVADGLWVAAGRGRREAIAGGRGPDDATVALGGAGWGAGQGDHELTENSWLTAPVSQPI